MMSSAMADDDVIIISSHVVGFIYFNNKVGSSENLVLMREPLCQYDKWEILVTLMEEMPPASTPCANPVGTPPRSATPAATYPYPRASNLLQNAI
eukprot:7453534-Ditylum_brightwellii.AAC.1